jgi:hypothetical protein
LHYVRARLCFALLGLAFAPTLGGASARAGYVPSEIVYSGLPSAQADGVWQAGFAVQRPAEVVAGNPWSLEKERQECLDDSFPLLPSDRRSGMEFRPGSGRSAPVSPTVRRGPSTLDVVFYPDSSAPRSPAARLSAFGDTVNLYHPCIKRLFRPPRPAPC